MLKKHKENNGFWRSASLIFYVTISTFWKIGRTARRPVARFGGPAYLNAMWHGPPPYFTLPCIASCTHPDVRIIKPPHKVVEKGATASEATPP